MGGREVYELPVLTYAAYKYVMIFWALYFCHTSFLFKIAVVRTKRLWDLQGATGSSEEVLLLQEFALPRFFPFFPLWVPVGGLVAAVSLSRFMFNVVHIFGSVYAL